MFPAVDVKVLLVLIPALPLAAAMITAALGKRVLRRRHLLVVVAIVLSFVLSGHVGVPGAAASSRRRRRGSGRWASVYRAKQCRCGAGRAFPRRCRGRPAVSRDLDRGDFQHRRHVAADPLTAVMLAMVTFISSLVAIYSIGYMHGDPGYWRFFAYIALFVFSMTMLVSVSNFVLLYVFWEAVGLCSYLLIGFWYREAGGRRGRQEGVSGQPHRRLRLRPGRVPDLDHLRHAQLPRHAMRRRWRLSIAGVLGQTAAGTARHLSRDRRRRRRTAICLLLFVGACGKSAQFPLHVWLPDAMEGPTPVSALIHAATMVTAGVYMVARCTPLFALSPTPGMWWPRSAASRPCWPA